LARNAGIGVIEIETLEIDGVPSIRTLFKAKDKDRERGLVYTGAITLPFRDFSYVVKVGC
jgi:hypothetical protein